MSDHSHPTSKLNSRYTRGNGDCIIEGTSHSVPEELLVDMKSTETTQTMGEVALSRFRDILTRGDCVPEPELANMGWNIPLVTTCEPSQYCLPAEIFSFHPNDGEIFKIFFKGTPKEVRIRQIFLHTPLSDEEQAWLAEFREYCGSNDFKIPLFLEPMLLRIIWLAYRKWGDNIMARSLELAKSMVSWREGFFPVRDDEKDIRPILDSGVMYWVGRDQAMRPLLIIRLARLQKTTSPEAFKRLTILCFEWGLRYLIVPGLVETVTVLLDVRGVPLHQFPISALTDMTNTLTKQYPFRLNRMWIINDSFFVQTVWNIAKQFLTEVQQQKMNFYRTGFEAELLKEYTPWQLEKAYGGCRPDESPTPSKANCSVSCDPLTAFGVLWEKQCRTPIQWTSEARSVFESLNLPVPDYLTGASSECVGAMEKDQGLKLSRAGTHLSTKGTLEREDGRMSELEAKQCTDVTILNDASGKADQSAVLEEPVQATLEGSQKQMDDAESANEETAAEAAPESHKKQLLTRCEEEQPAAAPPDTTGFVSVHESPETVTGSSTKYEEKKANKVASGKCCNRCSVQ